MEKTATPPKKAVLLHLGERILPEREADLEGVRCDATWHPRHAEARAEDHQRCRWCREE